MELSGVESTVESSRGVLCSVVEWSRVELTVDSSRFYSSRVKPSRVVEWGRVGWGGFLVGSGGVGFWLGRVGWSSRVERTFEWSVVECRGEESGRVGWSLVGSGPVRSSRVKRSRVEWSQVESIQVDSSQVESWSGVGWSQVDSRQSIIVNSSRF